MQCEIRDLATKELLRTEKREPTCGKDYCAYCNACLGYQAALWPCPVGEHRFIQFEHSLPEMPDAV